MRHLETINERQSVSSSMAGNTILRRPGGIDAMRRGENRCSSFRSTAFENCAVSWIPRQCSA
eukprot:523714-Alexandrium_andersonii.AAC.1